MPTTYGLTFPLRAMSGYSRTTTNITGGTQDVIQWTQLDQVGNRVVNKVTLQRTNNNTNWTVTTVLWIYDLAGVLRETPNRVQTATVGATVNGVTPVTMNGVTTNVKSLTVNPFAGLNEQQALVKMLQIKGISA